jgi:hypothetical protein
VLVGAGFEEALAEAMRRVEETGRERSSTRSSTSA